MGRDRGINLAGKEQRWNPLDDRAFGTKCIIANHLQILHELFELLDPELTTSL